MKPTIKQHNDFLARKPILGVAFQHNDYVKIIGGPFAPDAGSVVGIEELGVNPAYLIELESGTEQLVPQHLLELIAHD